MAEVSFFVASLIALAGAGGTVLLRNPFYAVLALVCHLLGLAALFLLLRAEFVAAAQVIVYAGAVMVLYVFVVAYVGGQDRPLSPRHGPGMRAVALVFAGALLVEFAIAIIGSGLTVLDGEGTGWFEAFGSPEEIGRLFLTKFLLAFEIASLLLLIAAVGAVILARRRSGLDDPRELSVADLMRTDEKGTIGGAERGTLQEAAGPPGH
jgi:NADH:ubiquinone oxidoreductase subunit 6 (subunit J)